MMPILASDFTGLLEIMLWFGGNVLYAVLLLIGWVLLAFRRTRSAGISMFKPLCWAGTMLLVLVGILYYPTQRRGVWESFFTSCSISAALFFSAYPKKENGRVC